MRSPMEHQEYVREITEMMRRSTDNTPKVKLADAPMKKNQKLKESLRKE